MEDGITKIQCTRCGRDMTGWSDESYQSHQRFHIKEEIIKKYPDFHVMVKEIEKEYGITLRIDFD